MLFLNKNGRQKVKTLEKIQAILREQKPLLQDKYSVKEIGVFGSFVRHEHDVHSDLDILVSFSTPIGFFKFMELEEYLSDIMRIKVDLVTRNALKHWIGKRILEEVQFI